MFNQPSQSPFIVEPLNLNYENLSIQEKETIYRKARKNSEELTRLIPALMDRCPGALFVVNLLYINNWTIEQFNLLLEKNIKGQVLYDIYIKHHKHKTSFLKAMNSM
jgi:hypothetical protein